MTATLLPNVDDQRIADQMALAKQLRDQGLSDKGNSGMAGNVYMVGNQYGNLAKSLGGAFLGYNAGQELGNVQKTREDEFNKFMQDRPSMYEEKVTPTEQYGPVQEGSQPLPMVPVKSNVLKSAAQILDDQQKWIGDSAASSNPLVQSIRQQALLKGLDWPEKMMAVEAQQQSAREKAAQQSADNAARREDTNAYRDAMLGIQQGNLDLRRDNAAKPTTAELKRQDAQGAAATAGKTMTATLDEMQEKINGLDKAEGISSTSRGGLSNSLSSLRNSTVGQAVGGVFGTKEQSLRNDLNNLGKSMLLQMKSLHNMGATQMNSNMELQTYLELVQGGKAYDKQALDNLIARSRREIEDRMRQVGASPSGNKDGGTDVIEGGVPPGVTPVRTGKKGGRALILGSDGKTYYVQ